MCKSSFPTPAKGVRDTHLVVGTLITGWRTDEKGYHRWDVYEGKPLPSFHSTLSDAMHIKISGDESKVSGRVTVASKPCLRRKEKVQV